MQWHPSAGSTDIGVVFCNWISIERRCTNIAFVNQSGCVFTGVLLCSQLETNPLSGLALGSKNHRLVVPSSCPNLSEHQARTHPPPSSKWYPADIERSTIWRHDNISVFQWCSYKGRPHHNLFFPLFSFKNRNGRPSFDSVRVHDAPHQEERQFDSLAVGRNCGRAVSSWRWRRASSPSLVIDSWLFPSLNLTSSFFFLFFTYLSFYSYSILSYPSLALFERATRHTRTFSNGWLVVRNKTYLLLEREKE